VLLCSHRASVASVCEFTALLLSLQPKAIVLEQSLSAKQATPGQLLGDASHHFNFR